MKISMPKPRFTNILIWVIAVLFSIFYWGAINPETITKTGKIASACLFAIICLALLCWTIYYCYYLIFVNENNKLPWDSWMLYASLIFLYVGVNLLSVFSIFEIQKIFICEIFFILFLAFIFARIIFNIIRKSGFFAFAEENIALFIAIFFGAFIVAVYFQTNLAANIIADILMGCISVLLITFMLKTFVVEQVKLKSLSDIMNFVFLFLTTIATSITTIYLLFWGLEADNHDLFNSIITVFAGVLGGALTLAGVAWTIRHGVEERADIEKKREKEHQEAEKRAAEPFFALHTYSNLVSEKRANSIKSRICLCEKGYEWRSTIINSSNSNFFIRGVSIQGKYYPLPYNNMVLKEQTMCLIVVREGNASEQDNIIELYVEDIIKNMHIYQMKYYCNKSDTDHPYSSAYELWAKEEIEKEE